jgi:hypothetical protein
MCHGIGLDRAELLLRRNHSHERFGGCIRRAAPQY